MADLIIPALFAATVWWLSTGIILYLDGLPVRTFRWSMLGVTVLLAVSLQILAITSAITTVAGAYIAFSCGVMIWAWQEMAFLLGFVTGPRKRACEHGCSGWRHFGHAVSAILYHELAILAGGAAVTAITWGQPNQVGTWTFFVLWGLRLSAKLNLFLGVRNLNKDWIPEHLAFVKGFLNQRPMNLLFPFSITLATVLAVYVVQAALSDDATDYEVTGFSLLGTLLGLAILEHWLLVLPLPTDALWAWGMRSRTASKSKPAAHLDPGGGWHCRSVPTGSSLRYQRSSGRRVPAEVSPLAVTDLSGRLWRPGCIKRRQR
jgi:putative photosynthetic complex assembly protein 2